MLSWTASLLLSSSSSSGPRSPVSSRELALDVASRPGRWGRRRVRRGCGRVSAMVSRSLTRAAQSGLAARNFCRRGILADLAGAVGEELGKILLELFGLHVVEVDVGGHAHFATSVDASGWGDWLGWRSSSRSLRRALWSWDLLLPVEHSSMVAISLCSKPSTSWRTKTMR